MPQVNLYSRASARMLQEQGQDLKPPCQSPPANAPQTLPPSLRPKV